MTERKLRVRRGRKRPVAGRVEILEAARSIGVREGWKAVTIRAIAGELGYAAPLLYEHFHDKEDVLTELALEAIRSLERELGKAIPTDDTALSVMVERYWKFMLEHTALYRLSNGMDGVPIDREKVRRFAVDIFHTVGARVGTWLEAQGAAPTEVEELIDELWALLHGMAALYLDRAMPFNCERAQTSALRLVRGKYALAPAARETDSPAEPSRRHL